MEEDGVEATFEVSAEISEGIRTGEWVGDCFIYTTTTNRLNYLVGDQTYTISHFDKGVYLLGYIQRNARVYITDKDINVTSFALSLNVVEYQTLVLRGDIESAAELLDGIPEDQKNKIARFLEGQGHKELALEIATDAEQKFDLALSLGHLDIALDLAREADVEHKWKTVGDAALTSWDVALSRECFTNAKDLGSLLLVLTSTNDQDGLKDLLAQASAAGSNNIAFLCLWWLGDIDGCIELLTRTERVAEALLFAQTYRPSAAPGVVKTWKESLEKAKKGKLAKSIGVPGEDDELFPEWEEYLRLEEDGLCERDLIDADGANGEADEVNVKAIVDGEDDVD